MIQINSNIESYGNEHQSIFHGNALMFECDFNKNRNYGKT